jgi:hypothetical protein
VRLRAGSWGLPQQGQVEEGQLLIVASHFSVSAPVTFEVRLARVDHGWARALEQAILCERAGSDVTGTAGGRARFSPFSSRLRFQTLADLQALHVQQMSALCALVSCILFAVCPIHTFRISTWLHSELRAFEYL